MEIHRQQGSADFGRLPLTAHLDCDEYTPLANVQLGNAPTSPEYAAPQPSFNPVKVEPVCPGCEQPIDEHHASTLLCVDGRAYHVPCLRCASCSLSLEHAASCFQKEGGMYCRACYTREFGTKCVGCERVIQSTDWVRRARSYVFHLACFACDQCKRQLSTGEEFALQENRLLCKQHYVELVEGDNGSSKTKSKRVRTTFAEEQLNVLQQHFQIDSNPDGADLERIANITGLSKRVTQVWFQNSRARQKKYQGKKGVKTESGRSSEDRTSPGCKSPSGSSSDGMIFPTSVTTSAEDAMMCDGPISTGLQSIHYD